MSKQQTFHVNITWASGKVDTLAVKAPDENTAVAKATQDALAYSEAMGWQLSTTKPYIVKEA